MSLSRHDSSYKTPSGGLVQHRVNNPTDWDDVWVFTDPRFKLEKGDDETLLQFLCNMLHPIVRSDPTEVE